MCQGSSDDMLDTGITRELSISSLFCQGNPLGEPSPRATPASENVHTLQGHPAWYVHLLEPAITYGDLLKNEVQR